MKNQTLPFLEMLEPRIAPAAVLTFTDVDGDTIKIVTSKGTNAELAAVVKLTAMGMGQEIDGINLSANPVFSGTNLSITATTPEGGAGDGFVLVDRIDALDDAGDANDTGLNLGSVIVDGKLLDIDAGTGEVNSRISSITVQETSGTSVWTLNGNVGSVVVKGDLRGAELNIDGSLGALRIGGSLIGENPSETGYVDVTHKIGRAIIGGDLQGGGGERAGAIRADLGIGSLSVGGDVNGGAGKFSGRVDADFIGSLRVVGNVLGGMGEYSGSLHSSGAIGRLYIGGDIVGLAPRTGVVNALGKFAKSKIGSARIDGSIIGNAVFSGVFEGEGGVGRLMIGGDVKGGDGLFSGSVRTGNSSFVSIGGSLLGGGASFAGTLSGGTLGKILIGGDLIGGSVSGSASSSDAGSIVTAAIGQLEIGGNVIAGADNSTGNLVDSGSIVAIRSIGTVHVHGNVSGTNGANGTTLAHVHADGEAGKTSGIRALIVDGSVTRAQVDVTGADGVIGLVRVAGDWTASSLASGVYAGMDGKFGTADDTHNDINDDLNLVSRIASIQIGGMISGTPVGGDHFGFVAQQIGSLRVGDTKVVFMSGAGNDNLSAADPAFTFGAFADVRAREVAV